MNTIAELAERHHLRRSGKSWRGNCPHCGYADAFSLRSGKAGRVLAWCPNCRDNRALFAAVTGTDTASQIPPADPAKAAVAARNRERALAVWRGAVPVTGTPAATYLERRRIGFLAQSHALRYRPDTPHPESSRRSAMIALVTRADGEPLGIHRTYISQDGRKADVEPVKASLGPIWGGAIRLMDLDPGKPLVLAEGIETAASASLLLGWPAWAAISAGNLAEGLALPAEARRVAIARDPDGPGWRAARDAWNRFRADRRDVTIATPTGPGDFNDTLMARGDA